MEGYLCHAAAWFLLGILFAKVFCMPIDESDRKVSKKKRRKKKCYRDLGVGSKGTLLSFGSVYCDCKEYHLEVLQKLLSMPP